MEHTLGVSGRFSTSKVYDVLILVLVEHTLGVTIERWVEEGNEVLILVLVEHTLGALAGYQQALSSLNPCFSGTYSRRI